MEIGNTEIIVAFLTGVAGPTIVELIKKYTKGPKSDKDKLVEEVKFSAIVEQKLEDIKNEIKADRIWVTQFHNGGNYYPTGTSIQKFSMFYEVVSPSVPSIKLTFQQIPVSLFSKSHNEILERNIISIPDFKDETTATYGLKHIAEENGTKSEYIIGIRSINDKLIGTLGIEYTKRKITLTPEDLQYLEIEATALGGVLSNYLNIKPHPQHP